MDKKQVVMKVLDGSTSNSIIPCSGLITYQQERKALFPIQRDLVVVELMEGGRTGKGCRGWKFSFLRLFSIESNACDLLLASACYVET